MPGKLAQFAGHNYLNLETYRRNGEAVRTPVWFAEDQGVFYIYSLADAGKIKRMRRNPRVRIAPCSFRGDLLGAWVDATTGILDGPEAARGDELLDKKYGWQRKLGNLWRRIVPKQRTVVAIEPDSGRPA
ncbi:MAG: PPOX class F420-dependent oxidoreductase [Terriglobales bacterium]